MLICREDWRVVVLMDGIVVELEAREVWEEQAAAAAYNWLGLDCVFVGGGNLVLEMNVVHAGDKYFSAGDERVENACSSFSHTHTHTHSYLPATSKQNLCQDDCYSHSYLPPKWALSH